MASTGGLNGSDPKRRDSLICFNPICSDKADDSDEMAQRYEEAGVAGIHPSATTLRKTAQAKRKMAAQYRESATKLA